ncbi:hypothetical protein MAM1_0762c11208, partial [Mucor ambiguus]
MNPEQQDIIMNESGETHQVPIDETISSVSGSIAGSTSGIKTPTLSCPESAIERLQTRIKDARKELEDIYTGDACPEEALEAADKISKRITSYETHLNALTDKAEKQLRPVNLRDIPRFQIVGQNKHYEGYPSYSSLEHFFSSFETVMHASGNDVERVWKQYIPVAMHFTYKTWVNNDLLKCPNWEAAKALFIKHYGVPVNSLDLISRLFNMRMKTSDTLQNYTNRFMKNVQEAGFPLESNTLAKFYQCSLLKKNQQMMVNQMLVKKDSNHRWTINEIYECVLPLFLADEQARVDSEVIDLKGKRKTDATGTSSKAVKMVSTGYFCPKHGGKAANHNVADCRSRVKNFGAENRPNRATTAAPATTNSSSSEPDICNHCHKPRVYGHRCREFYIWKKEREAKRNINVHTVQTADDRKGDKSGDAATTGGTGESSTAPKGGNANEDVTMEEIDAYLDEIETEEASLNCKSNVKSEHESFNPFQLLTPIILESKEGKPVRLIAKVDTGSDSTFLNKNIFHNKLHFTSQDILPVEGNLNFLSHSVKRLGKSPAIKIRYLNDISFDHSFELSNFIQDLGKFDVLLGVDTLSRLRIGLTGVAHKFADIGHLTEEEKSDLLESIDFENVNFDTKHSIDPETASIFESQAEEKKYMSYIQDAIDENQKIKPGTFCNVPESEITIPIKENVDYYVKQYPIAHHAMPEIEKQLNEWLDAGIVEQCRPNGLFNSPLIAVSKKDNDGKPTKIRVCMDVRRINQHMPNNTNQFEIPNIQDIFTRIKQKGTIYAKIDLRNAYFSFKISDASRNVLLFNFRGKTYRWLGCCFGLRPITSVFSSVMNILFSDMPNVEVYVDDLCLVSSSLSSHCELIKEVLRRLTNANLKIGVEKCSWFRSSIYLLGFVIGPHVSKVDMRRLSDIDHWGPCKSAKQVKQLAGVISYLRPHIPNLAKLMAPIDALRNDPDAGSKWTAEHTKRLEIIKKVLLSEALLTAPDMNKKFYLECDA